MFAAGDVANFPSSPLGKRIRVEHEDHANTHGRAVGANMAGANAPYDYLPFFYSDMFDLGYEAVGEVDSRLATLEAWEEPNRKGVITYVDDERRPRGFLLWDTWGKVDAARELIRAAQPVDEACCLASALRAVAEAEARDGGAQRVRVPPARARRRRSSSRRCACRRRVVVLASTAAGLAGAVELARGHLVVAALLVQLKTVLDNADGQLARLTDRVTAFGRYLDSECDLLVNAALFAAVGWTTGSPLARRGRVRRAHGGAERQLQPRAARPRRPGVLGRGSVLGRAYGARCTAGRTG